MPLPSGPFVYNISPSSLPTPQHGPASALSFTVDSETRSPTFPEHLRGLPGPNSPITSSPQLFLFTSLLVELQTAFRRPKPPRTSLTTIRASLSLLGITRKLSHYIIKVLIHLPKDPTPGYQVLDYLRDIPGFSVPSLALVLL